MNERRARILDLVAASYIHSAHPVASARVAEWMSVSSATVRNEFAALADAGMLQQAHSSSGRIPTARGFHAYAQRFLPPRPPTRRLRDRLQARLQSQAGETVLDQLAGLAAELSGYAVVVTLPADDHLHAVEIHLSLLASRTLLAVVVLENGMVRQLRVPLDPAPGDAVLDDAERNLRQLTLPLRQVPEALRRLATDADPELARTLLAIAAGWREVTPQRSARAGLRHLFDEPEARDPDFVRLLVERIEAPRADGDDDAPPAEAVELRLDEGVAQVRSGLRLGAGSATLTLLGPARMRYWATVQVAGGLAALMAEPGTTDA